MIGLALDMNLKSESGELDLISDSVLILKKITKFSSSENSYRNVWVISLMIEKELSEQAEVLCVDFVLAAVNLEHRNGGLPVDLIPRRMLNSDDYQIIRQEWVLE